MRKPIFRHGLAIAVSRPFILGYFLKGWRFQLVYFIRRGYRRHVQRYFPYVPPVACFDRLGCRFCNAIASSCNTQFAENKLFSWLSTRVPSNHFLHVTGSAVTLTPAFYFIVRFDVIFTPFIRRSFLGFALPASSGPWRLRYPVVLEYKYFALLFAPNV